MQIDGNRSVYSTKKVMQTQSQRLEYHPHVSVKGTDKKLSKIAANKAIDSTSGSSEQSVL